MNLKKNILRIIAIIYDIVALFWCGVITSDLIYAFTKVQVNEQSMAIIGGADIPTAIFEFSMLLRLILPILFVVLTIFNVIILTVSAFENMASRKLNIWLTVLLAISLCVFILIPAQTYIVTLYALFENVYFIRYTYIFVSIFTLALNILSLAKRKDTMK